MTTKLHHITLCFENVDYIEIPARYFCRVALSDIRTSVWCFADGSVSRAAAAYAVMLELLPQANADAASFAGDLHEVHYNGGALFDRLQRPDIVSIKLVFKDGTEENYGVVWDKEPDNEFRNRLQTAELLGNGNLQVTIGGET